MSACGCAIIYFFLLKIAEIYRYRFRICSFAFSLQTHVRHIIKMKKKRISVTLRRRANYFVQYQVEFIDVHNRHISYEELKFQDPPR